MGEDTRLKIGVVGGGLMGHGIAYLFAAAGHRVGIYEPSPQVRLSMPRRLQSIVELLDDDPRLLQRIESHDMLAPAMRERSLSLRPRRRNCR
jgi:3-hydroxybutyryl-CoA dehydrogenase